jgi:site-specific DNA recombinase
MMKKKCISYLRFSADGQSNSSIERQQIITETWCINNDVEILAAYKDEGYSARTFDRPDIKKLFSLISTNRNIDYLIVSDLTRFSRELGDAVNMVKNIQNSYQIKIVSAGRNAIYDVHEPTSYFMMALEFLIGNTENIKRSSDINGGIYAAKKREGRYVHAAPYGYKNIRLENNKPGIAPNEETAPVVRFIFNSFLSNMPLKEIGRQAKKMGYTQKGRSAIQRILTNKIYIGILFVKAYKEYPEEWVKGIHMPLIDSTTFYEVQKKLTKKNPVQIINDRMPLRGVLKCWCNKPLTGAPSTSKTGRQYDYYKCNVSSAHNNISVIKAHQQLNEIWKYLSLPGSTIIKVRNRSEQMLEDQLKENTKLLQKSLAELKKVETDLQSMEEKYIRNQIEFDTYQRWYTQFSTQRIQLQAQVQVLKKDENETWYLLETELEKLSDLNYVYNAANTLQKQQLVRIGFDNRLYYQQGIYRTPYIMPILSHNALILKEKNLLLLDEKNGNSSEFPLGGAHGTTIELLHSLLSFIHSVKIA